MYLIGISFSGQTLVASRGFKVKIVGQGFFHGLNTELPCGEYTHADGFVQILTVEIGVLSRHLQGLIPNKSVNSKRWGEVDFHEMPLPFSLSRVNVLTPNPCIIL